MRILYITQGWTVHDRRFVRGLLESGHTVAYCAVDRTQATDQDDLAVLRRTASAGEWEAGGSRFWWRLPTMVSKVRGLLRDFQPEVIHAGPIQRGAFVAALAGARPLVSMSWGSDLLWAARRGLGWSMARFVLARTDSLVCDCETVRRRSLALGMNPQRVVVFPWGVDLKAFTPNGARELRNRLGWEGDFVLISARAWDPLYGVDLVADAFSLAAGRQPELRLLLLGDGSDRRRIRSRLEANGAMPRVHFAGVVPHRDLPAYFGSADLYVSASRSDGSSVTLLEAMASGLPSIVSDIPSNLEWVEAGLNGWTFRDGDALSLAEVMSNAVRDKSRLKNMGGAARRLVEAKADWSINFPRLFEAYTLARTAARGHAV